MKNFIGLFICGLLVFSCNKESKSEPIIEPVPVTAISFSLAVQPIFNTSCNGGYCHGVGADGKYFNTYSNVTAVPTATLLGAINHSAGFEAMPKSQAKLSQGKIDTITTWINEGSLDN
jgi:hypothetical protein|tara:strand:- start:1579 stop:1932 length:354 start_codon:yes stop_codon:yes gene_type:complete